MLIPSKFAKDLGILIDLLASKLSHAIGMLAKIRH